MPIGPYLSSTAESGFLRYGNWTGGGYSANSLSPSFIALTPAQDAVPGYDQFDMVSALHDQAYDIAQQTLLTNLQAGMSGSAAMVTFLTAIEQADQAFAAGAAAVQATTPWGITMQQIGINVMSTKEQWEAADIQRIRDDPTYSGYLNQLAAQPGSLENALNDINTYTEDYVTGSSSIPPSEPTPEAVSTFESQLYQDNPFLAQTEDQNVLASALVQDPGLAVGVTSLGALVLLYIVGGTAADDIDQIINLVGTTVDDAFSAVSDAIDEVQHFIGDALFPSDGRITIDIPQGEVNVDVSSSGNSNPQYNDELDLVVDQPESLSGTIVGLEEGDTIDLVGIIATGASFGANSVLTLTDSGATAATLHLDPSQDFSYESFLIAPDGTDGTNIISEDDSGVIPFTGVNETLLVINAANLTGSVSAFVNGDTIDLVGLSATGGTLNATDLTIQETGGGTLTYAVSDSASPQNVYAIPDGNGGTNLVLTEPVPVTTVPGAETVIEGDPTFLGGLSVTVPGGPSINEIITVVLSDGSGLLAATQAGEGTVTGDGTQRLTLSGSLDDVNAELASFSYTGTVSNSSDVINVATTNDQGTGDEHQIEVMIDGSAPNPTPPTIYQPTPTGPSYITPYGTPNTTIYSTPNGSGSVIGTETTQSIVAYTYTFTGSTFTGFDNPVGFTGTSPLQGLYVYGSISFDTTAIIPLGYINEVIQLQNLFITDGITTYSGPTTPGDGNVVDLNSGFQVVEWALVGGSGTVGQAGYGAVGTSGAYDSGNDSGLIIEPPYIEYAGHSYVPTKWSAGVTVPETSVSVSPLSGQTMQLADALQNSSLIAPGALHYLTVNGPGVVEFDGVATIPVLLIGGNGSLVLQGGTINTDPVTIDAGGNITGYGTITGSETANGTVTASGGTLDITGDITGSGTLTFASGAALQLEGNVAATESLIFTGDNETLILGPSASVSAAVSGIGLGDVIALEGQQVTGAIYDPAQNILEITGSSGGTYSLSLIGTYQQSDFGIADGEVQVACFREGTRISTKHGDVPVEELEIGDIVHTRFAGLAAVKWIGHRRVDCRHHPDPRMVWPVRVQAGAFGDGLPHSELWLSPDHAVFVEGGLIAIRQLINRTTIAQMPVDKVTYFHVELDRHDVVLAEGLPAESYLDSGNRSAFANAGMPIQLHADFSPSCPESRAGGGCAPLLTEPDQVEPIWRSLAERAATLGHPVALPITTTNSDLRLRAAGRDVQAIEIADGRHVFVLPPRTDGVKIMSRSGVPADFRPWLDDRRRLGVSVTRIVMRGRNVHTDVPVDHPALVEGWHDVETAGVRLWRWTDGAAVLSVPAGTRVVEVHVAGSGEYAATEGQETERKVA